MGYRTLIEINHDWYHQVSEKRDEFVAEILEQLRAGQKIGDQIPGGRIVAMRHHTEQVPINWGGNPELSEAQP